MKTLATPLTLALAACVLATTSATALAAHGPTRAAPGGAPTAGKTPALYTVAQSDAITAPGGIQTRGTISCPAGTVVWSGGVVIAAPSLGVTLNSSYPMSDGSGWIAAVNNATGADATFTVQAVCARKPRQYTMLESGVLPAPAGGVGTGALPCPGLTRPVGGGSQSSSRSTAVSIGDSFPELEIDGYLADQANRSSVATTFRVFAICARPSRTYHVVTGTVTALPPGTQQHATATCPGLTRPVGGGALTGTGSPAVSLDSSGVTQDGWSAFAGNTGLFPGVIVEAFAICA
jgi:hypothetical protein